jgi:prefoldin subunit 5
MVDEAEQDMQELRRTRGRLYGTMQYYQQRAEALDQSIQRIEAERLELQEINENVNARLDARIHARLLRQERAGG